VKVDVSRLLELITASYNYTILRCAFAFQPYTRYGRGPPSGNESAEISGVAVHKDAFPLPVRSILERGSVEVARFAAL
jgi:hypothetical protein